MAIDINLVNRLITQLETLNLTIYVETSVDTDQVEYMYSIIRQLSTFQKFIITKTPKIETFEEAILAPRLVQFYSVHYGAEGTLILNDLTSNVIPAQINIIRSVIQFFWRSRLYTTTFQIPQIDRLREIKQSICGIFTFATPQAYVLLGKIMFVFVYVKDFLCPLYIGILDHDKMESNSLVVWDWADGTLIGKLNGQMYYVWNDQSFFMINQHPNLYWNETNIQLYIPGGKDAFAIEYDTSSVITKGTLAAPLHKQEDILQGQLINYINLKDFIRIPGLVDDQIYYIVSFSNITFTTTYDEPSNFPTFATVGFANFRNSNYPLVIENAICVFVQNKDDTFYRYGPYFYYKYDDATQTMTIYQPTFDQFIQTQTGNMVIQDLRSYPINLASEFSNECNLFTPNIVNSRSELEKTICGVPPNRSSNKAISSSIAIDSSSINSRSSVNSSVASSGECSSSPFITRINSINSI